MNPTKVLEDDNHASEGVLVHEEKGKTTGLESLMSSAQRRKLADISNLQDQAKPVNRKEMHQQQNMLLSSNEYAEKLQKENMTLMKALAHRNKIIELSSVEFQKLKINFRHVQEKNLQLAQAHSQMLAELNTNRDRLKELQHELGCKNVLLIAKKQLEEQKIQCTQHASKVPANTSDGDCRSSQAHDMHHRDTKQKRKPSVKSSGNSNVKPLNVNEKANRKRRVSGVTETTGVPEETCQTEDDTEKGVVSQEANQIVDNVINEKFVLDAANPVKDSMLSKRQCARRQSTRFDCQETEQTEKLLEMDEAKETTRPVFRRQSARLRSEEAEPCKSFHERGEIKETIKRRRVSSRLDSEEPEVTETLNAGDAGSLVSKESNVSRSEVVELSESNQDTKEPNWKRRVSTRRRQSQTATETDEAIIVVKNPCLIPSSVCEEGPEIESMDNKPKADETLKACDAGSLVSNGSRSEAVELSESRHDMKEPKGKRRASTRRRQSQTATETDEAIKEVTKNPCLIPSSVSEECHEMESSHNKPKADETEEIVRRPTMGRPSRHAAEKVQSYREVSLKVKMRR